MEKKNTGFIVLVVVLIIAVLGLGGYIIYDKVLNNDNSNNQNNNNEQDNVSDKISVTRKGITSFEKVPSILVGKYVNSNDPQLNQSYFEIKSDGSFIISEPTGGEGLDVLSDDEVNLNIYFIYEETSKTSGDRYNHVILEFITTDKIVDGRYGDRSGKGYLYIGRLQNGEFSFAPFENTPVANAYEFVYKK